MSKVLLKGNIAIAESSVIAGCRYYFGYPITPQNEIPMYLSKRLPEVGGVFVQAESELASINMVFGASAAGARVMTTTSSPGYSLMQEGISYMAGAELPCVLLNVVRGGPGLGTIQPAQSDYFQSTKGGGHGDYRLIVIAPSSVQEMYNFVELGYKLAFRYRTPVMVQSDGAIGQMMEKVEIGVQKQRFTEAEIIKNYPWATTGKTPDRERNIITSLDLDPSRHERHNIELQKKYKKIEEQEILYEKVHCDDAEYLFVAYGTSARLCLKSIQLCREKGIKVGLLRPITLWPFPKDIVFDMADQVKGILSVEMSAGQMVEDILLSVKGKVPVKHFGRMGGIIPSPIEIADMLEEKFIKG